MQRTQSRGRQRQLAHRRVCRPQPEPAAARRLVLRPELQVLGVLQLCELRIVPDLAHAPILLAVREATNFGQDNSK